MLISDWRSDVCSSDLISHYLSTTFACTGFLLALTSFHGYPLKLPHSFATVIPFPRHTGLSPTRRPGNIRARRRIVFAQRPAMAKRTCLSEPELSAPASRG